MVSKFGKKQWYKKEKSVHLVGWKYKPCIKNIIQNEFRVGLIITACFLEVHHEKETTALNISSTIFKSFCIYSAKEKSTNDYSLLQNHPHWLNPEQITVEERIAVTNE